MHQALKDKINGYGLVLRFVTPALLGLSLFVLNYITADLRLIHKKLDNHIEHEMRDICERITSLETKIDILIGGYDGS